MDHMLGQGWRDLFDVIITKARKPSFYHQPTSRFAFKDLPLYSVIFQNGSV